MDAWFRGRRLVVLIGACFAIALGLYARGFDNGFRRDDYWFLEHVISQPAADAVFHPLEGIPFFRPGAVAVFLLEYRLFGLAGGPYIAFNFILHALIALATWAVLRALGFRREVSVTAAGFFLIGFGHFGKQVLWACTSGPLVAVLLSLVAVLATKAWLGAAAARTRARHLWPPVTVAVLLAGPLFHELAFLTPLLVMPLLLGRQGRRAAPLGVRLAVLLGPILLWSAVFLQLSATEPRYMRMAGEALAAPLYQLRHVLRSLAFMVIPFQQCYLLEQAPAFLGRLGGIAGILQMTVGGLLVAASILLLRRGDTKLRFLVLWIYLAILPFGYIRLSQDWFCLRYVYYAAVPFCGLLAAAAVRLLAGRRTWRRAIVLTVLAVYAAGVVALLVALERQYDLKASSAAHRAWLAELEAAREAAIPAGTSDNAVGAERESP